MPEFEYDKELFKQLSKDKWLRHLFNKLGTEVKVTLKTGERIRGILKTIEYIKGKINLEIETTDSSVFYVNWKYVQYLKARKQI